MMGLHESNLDVKQLVAKVARTEGDEVSDDQNQALLTLITENSEHLNLMIERIL